jgi:hypothetical protein
MENPEAVFMGKVTAGITHEFKNVLAIIKESSGLMGDLLSLCEKGAFPYEDKFANALSTIQEQLDRGVALASRLNHFAHTTDEPIATVDLAEALERIVFLSQRFARLLGVAVRAESTDQALTMAANPLQLQMALFSSLECCWEQMRSGGVVTVCPTSYGEACAVRFSCEGGSGDRSPFEKEMPISQRWAILEDLLGAMGAKIEMDESIRGFFLILPKN